MQENNSQIRNILALFSLCNPELIKPLESRVPANELVAANLISKLHYDDASICIHAVDGNQYNFKLDLNDRIYQSKGNWVWVKQIDICYPAENLLNITVLPSRVIDLPYSDTRLCAHWLFRNVSREINQEVVDSYL